MSLVSQRSLAGGELSPELYARTDTIKYQTGVATARNVFIAKAGGLANRPGTIFIGKTLVPSKKSRLIPFVLSSAQKYILSFCDGNISLIENDLYSGANLTITGATKANPGVISYTGSTPLYCYYVIISGVSGMTQINGVWRVWSIGGGSLILVNPSTGLALDTTSFGTYVSGGNIRAIYGIGFSDGVYDEAESLGVQHSQFGSDLFIANKDHKVRWLRGADAPSTLSLSDAVFGPPDFSGSVSISGGPGTKVYCVTKLNINTGEESLKSTTTLTSNASNPQITLPAPEDGYTYNIYRKSDNFELFGYVGSSEGTKFSDYGTPDYDSNPPKLRSPFGTYKTTDSTKPVSVPDTPGDYPSVVGVIQQRIAFAASVNDPEGVHLSKIGLPFNFSNASPIDDASPISFKTRNKVINKVKHIIDIGKPIVFTEFGEFVLEGDGGGNITPSQISPRQYSYNGSSDLSPLIIDGTALYVQSRGNIVRDISYEQQSDGYRGNDLSVFSTHLFDGFTIVSWALQRVPHSMVWAVRSDGALLSLTYVKEHQIWGWTRHDTDGFFEDVCSIPGDEEDDVYFVVKRTINGVETRYIEKLAKRKVFDEKENIFMDSALTYDGRNTDVNKTMTVSGGTNWGHTENLTLTASSAFFSVSDIGNEIHMSLGGETVRLEILTYTSTTVVTVRPNRSVPTGLRGVATSSWTRAVDVVSGLDHLERKQVSILADGFVVASPNNSDYDTYTVINGSVTLDRPYGLIHVGLPYLSDIETLNIDSPTGESVVDKKSLPTHVTAHVFKTRGLWCGEKKPSDDFVNAIEGLSEFKLRNTEGYESAISLKSEAIDVKIQARWERFGKIFMRQVDPLPMQVNSIMPAGFFPFRG